MALGLIEGDVLTAIADAIRAKTETTDKMLPVNMAALIEGIKTSKEIHWGLAISQASNTTTSIQTGVTLPVYEHYGLFVVFASTTGTSAGGFAWKTPNEHIEMAYLQSQIYPTETWQLQTTANGTALVTGKNVFYTNKQYLWVYFSMED